MQEVDSFVTTLSKWIEVFMHQSMRNMILFSKEYGLSMPQIGALFHIHKGASGVSELGDGLGVTSAAASQMLERLVQSNLILRSEDPHDRRVKQLVLTEKGHQILHESIHARQSWLGDLANALSEGEKEQIITSLNILINRASQLETTAGLGH